MSIDVSQVPWLRGSCAVRMRHAERQQPLGHRLPNLMICSATPRLRWLTRALLLGFVCELGGRSCVESHRVRERERQSNGVACWRARGTTVHTAHRRANGTNFGFLVNMRVLRERESECSCMCNLTSRRRPERSRARRADASRAEPEHEPETRLERREVETRETRRRDGAAW